MTLAFCEASKTHDVDVVREVILSISLQYPVSFLPLLETVVMSTTNLSIVSHRPSTYYYQPIIQTQQEEEEEEK